MHTKILKYKYTKVQKYGYTKIPPIIKTQINTKYKEMQIKNTIEIHPNTKYSTQWSIYKKTQIYNTIQ